MNQLPLPVSEGLRADGVLVEGRAPLGTLWVPLRGGLTVLYGRNGAGKTRLLEAIASAMTGVRLPTGNSSLHLSFTDEFEGWHGGLVETLGHPDNFLIDALLDHVSSRDDAPVVDDEDLDADDLADDDLAERVTKSALARVRSFATAVAQLHGLGEGLCHSPRIALMADGDATHPMWNVGVSVVPSDVRSFRDAFPQVQVLVDVDGNPLPVVVGHLSTSGSTEHGDWRDEGLSALGEIACLVADDSTDISATTLTELVLAAGGEGDLLECSAGGEYRLADQVLGHAESLSSWASSIVETLAGRPLKLRCEILNPNEWLTRPPVSWTAADDRGTVVPIADLGSGLARWARLAISLALRGGDMLRPAIVLIDEPERALHSAAQRDTAAAFQEALVTQELLGLSLHGAIVATHSPAFLALADAHLVQVTRATNGDVELRELDTTIGVEALTAEAGITRADALLAVRAFLFVEGEHELSVLSAMFGEVLQRRHIVMFAMRGAANIGGYVAAQELLTYSDATIRVVVDQMGSRAEAKWAEARAAFAEGDRDAASRAIHKLENMQGDRFNWLFNAARSALELGVLDRIELVVLGELDIIKYLPVGELVPGAASWDDLDREYAEIAHPRPPYKKWIEKAKGVRITGPILGDIASRSEPVGDIHRSVAGL